MKEQLKAEAYVRSQRPALIFTSVCRVSTDNPDGVRKNGKKINLQDWVAALGEKNIVLIDIVTGGDIAKASVGETYITFNLTDGQPSNESDYKAFNNIVGI